VLTAVEGGQDIPFEVKRVYLLHDIATDRGGHAHRDTHQLVIAASGSFELVLSDNATTRRYLLGNPARGLYVVPMLFIELKNFSHDATAVVLASTHYDKSRSLRSWEAYREARGF
jgi:dTDP-4-dehydrorhamnose 3,5-epimerase-like enzyme